MSYKKNKAFGLDISDSSIKIISLNRNKEIEVCLSSPLPMGTVVNGKIKDKQVLSELITELKEKSKSKLETENVILSLPESKIFAHVFSIPTSLVKNPKVILKLAQEHIPLDLNESIFDYKILRDKEISKKEKRIYFVAVEERLVFDYLEVLNLAKLNPIAIDIEPSSIARALSDPDKKELDKKIIQKLKKQKELAEKKAKAEQKKKDKKNKGNSVDSKKPDNQPNAENINQDLAEAKNKELESVENLIKENLPSAEMVLDIGSKHSMVTIFYGKNVFPSISMPIGGQTFTQILKDALNIKDYTEAEKMKKEMKVESEGYNKSKNNLEAEYDKLIKEIKTLVKYFEKNNEIIVNKLHLSGGSSQLDGLYEYFVSNFEFDVVKAKAKIQGKDEKCNEGRLINAFGLAIRGIAKDPVTEEINLLPAHQKKILVEQQAKSAIIYSSLVVLFVSSMLIASFNIVLSNLYFDLEGLNKANESFKKIVEGQRYKEIQAHVQELNDNVQVAKQNQNQNTTKTYSIQEYYNYFYANIPKTITVNQLNYSIQGGKDFVSINGFALTRDKVLEIQAELEETPFYTNLSSPLSNVLKQDDIYFTFSFNLDFNAFQEFLIAEEKRVIEEARKKREEKIRKLKEAAAAAETGTEKNTSKKDIPAFSNGTGTNTPIKPIIDLGDNLIESENLEDLNTDIVTISENIQEDENAEDEQIKEALENPDSEYPFQDKIHEKVGNIFVVEEEDSSAENQ